MNTKELVKELQVQFEEIIEGKLNQEQSRSILDAVFNTISDTLVNGDKVDVTGFGKFEAVQRAERKGRNPQTSEELIIPASIAPKFKPAKALKDKLNGK